MEIQYIYALQNKSFGAHHIKIGRTKRKPVERATELYRGASGVPEPFKIAFVCQVTDCILAEKKIHKQLKAYRNNKEREFFIIPIDVASKVIFNVCQQINKSSGYFIENPVVVDNREPDESDQFSNESETNELSGVGTIRWADLKNVRLAPLGKSSLSYEQKQRIEIISTIVSRFFPRNAEDWNKDFSRDENPEIEICVWENIIKAFLKIDQVRYLSDEQKKEAFILLFMRSMMSTSKVLENWKLYKLPERAVKEILRGYEAKPVMLVIGHFPILR